MDLKLFYEKSVHENAAHYYELAKESREKIAGVEKAIEETKKEIGNAKKGKKKEVRTKRQKEWYEKFHSCFTSAGHLMIGGRNAQQNDQIFAKHMEDKDLFFHADIQGASAVVLKDGIEAKEEELKEAAQFAASFSKAWINANASVDVYAVKKAQLSKHVSGGFIPTGAFAISGERIWFRDTKLELRIGKDEKSLLVLVPSISKTTIKNALVLVPSKSGKDKGAIAKSLAKRYDVHPDALLEILPNGKSKTVER
ncbi:MAG: NFACT RNA binding domain-containing protein [Candidatus ainarchaeum sp.]|nr:NFACT RNA binding domain-containing protein [Candidatus ainarchaeum sp.]